MDGRVPLKIDTHWTSIVNTDLLKIEVEGRAKEPSERALSSEQWLPQILKDSIWSLTESVTANIFAASPSLSTAPIMSWN